MTKNLQKAGRGFIRRGKALVFSSGTQEVLTFERLHSVVTSLRNERTKVKFEKKKRRRC